MKIKIDKEGYEQFTGQMGTVSFVDGVSVADVSEVEAKRLGAALPIVWLDEKGEHAGVANVAADLVAAYRLQAKVEEMVVGVDKEREKPVATAPVEPVVRKHYTEAELAAVADKHGIAGLREIGAVWNVKGRSIPELIKDILNAQAAEVH